jgi:hypothetical protein
LDVNGSEALSFVTAITAPRSAKCAASPIRRAREGLLVPPARVRPAAQELSARLRQLRIETWPAARLTQAALATAFAAEEPVAPATISSWESADAPKLPPRHRVIAYARFFSTDRSVEGGAPRLLPMDALTEEEMGACRRLEKELLGLHTQASGQTQDQETVYQRSWLFTDSGPATIVCAQLPADEISEVARKQDLTNPRNPNYTELLKFADLDALVELHGHIRAENPSMNVYFRASTDVEPDYLTGHLILVGGMAWNEVTKQLSEMASLPVRQIGLPSLKSGDIFVANDKGKEEQFLPTWREVGTDTLLEADVGLLARVPNPLNSSRTLTICNGIHSRGVYGAVRSLTDERLREANERYVANHFGSSSSFIILMSVKVIEGKTMTPDFNSPGVVKRQWKWPLEEER